jgi:hypothetical protein
MQNEIKEFMTRVSLATDYQDAARQALEAEKKELQDWYKNKWKTAEDAIDDLQQNKGSFGPSPEEAKAIRADYNLMINKFVNAVADYNAAHGKLMKRLNKS